MALPPIEDAPPDLVHLVGDWASVPDAAEITGTDVVKVRRALADRELLAMRVAGAPRVPVAFLGREPGAVALPELRGTLTVLADAGFTPGEIVRWLFTPAESLREGRPVDALRAGHKGEVRRRAQALAM